MIQKILAASKAWIALVASIGSYVLANNTDLPDRATFIVGLVVAACTWLLTYAVPNRPSVPPGPLPNPEG